MKKVVNSMDCKILELEHLVLRNLAELKAIIDGTIPEESNSFQKLESLNLRNLPKLVHLWSSLNQNVSGGNLKSISIVNCPNLRYVLSAATTRSLVQLQHLEILHCDAIEQVLWNEMEVTPMLVYRVSDVEGADTYPSAEPYNFLPWS